MPKNKSFTNANVSLTPQIFYILLTLAIKERHGYDIMKQVELDSQGKVTLGPGTLYGAIKRMLEEKLINEVNTHHTRRKYYRLTDKGKTIFTNELERYNEAVELAKRKNLFSQPIAAKLALSYA